LVTDTWPSCESNAQRVVVSERAKRLDGPFGGLLNGLLTLVHGFESSRVQRRSKELDLPFGDHRRLSILYDGDLGLIVVE